jgi:hypothetical protein
LGGEGSGGGWSSSALLALTLAACTGVSSVGPGKTDAPPGFSGAGAGAVPVGSGGGSSVIATPGAGATGVVPPPPPAACDGSALSESQGLTTRRARRLSKREYTNVINDLLGAKAQQEALAALPDEPLAGGLDNQNAVLFVDDSLQEHFADLAAQLSSESDPTTLATCATAGGSPACLQTFIRSFASKAYGRPLSDAEFNAANTLASMGQDYATQVRLVIEMVLQSPYMIYTSELGPDGNAPSADPVPLTQYEVASQLSLMLAGTRPDATLMAAAASGGLTKPADIQAQVNRLLPSAQGQAALVRFINGWLNMGPISLTDLPKDAGIYPQFTADVATAMQQEYDQFVTAQLNGGNGTMAGFFTAMSSAVPTALKPIYGTDLLATGAPDPKHRKGILSLPAVLATASDPDNSGPVQRGLLIRRQLLCQTVPAPPANVLMQIANMPIDATDTTKTTRQKLDAHLNQPSCSACHSTFDPIGYGLEDMDALGRFRSTESGLPVDSSGALTGTDVDGAFEGPADLSTKLAQSKLVESCMVSHFFNFAQARDTAPSDQCVLKDWSDKFAAGGGRINDLIAAYVAHPNFAYRKDDR